MKLRKLYGREQRRRAKLNKNAETENKPKSITSLNDQWTDATTAHGRLMLTVLSGLAEFECELIKARTTECPRSRRSVWAQTQANSASATRGVSAAREALTEIARSYNVSHSTISRLDGAAFTA